ncbi:outer membrane protein assembly factor BamB family protein [Parapedobacter lycopersici]|uniref:outer membrane protein assembly factor BamB family protein n=1 Tax=Parapedobacter lycopersici TaxID=1864939 RepID=UPI00214DDAEF|nr:PQQ-binding-like beta-propeller repeat protein [Parapedobacter lycopersici]
MMRNGLMACLLATGMLYINCTGSGTAYEYKTGTDWPVYGGNKAGNRYSPLTQITPDNVGQLEVAWMFDAAETPEPGKEPRALQIQTQPIVVRGVLYGTTPGLKLFAVDAATGELRWKFDPPEKRIHVNRGVVYWERGDDRRILYTVGPNLYAVDADRGVLVEGFGTGGAVSLYQGLDDGLDREVSGLNINATSPGVIYKDVLVMGSSVSEDGNAAPGYVRGFDVVTGKLLWVFHTVPHPGEVGYDTWPADAYQRIGGVNSWPGMVVDELRGTVYFGTGSPASDFYGGDRPGANLFSNSIVALDAETGKLKWYYQTIRHDLWDRDIPSQPNLVTVRHNGKLVDAVAQATKDGLVYVLDRDSGEPLFPVEERPVPTVGLPGEQAYPTQKFPLKPAPFAHQVFTEDDITDISPESHAYIRERYLKYRTDHKYTPPSVEGTILFGYSGGAEWGGNATDPEGILYVNSNNDPWLLQMVDTATLSAQTAKLSEGHALYAVNCASCHGADRQGNGLEFPSLRGIGSKLSTAQLKALITAGTGRMPSFGHLPEGDRERIVDYLLNPDAARPRTGGGRRVESGEPATEERQPFGFKPLYVKKVWERLTDQDGYPGVKPPWGTLNAIDLNTGEYVWRVPLGEYPELTAKGVPITGTENYGGPVVTASGLIFIAGTRDERIRAFDKKTGKVLWEYQLPAGGFATPITYEVDGRQYVVIAAGGARGAKLGGNYIAFALK